MSDRRSAALLPSLPFLLILLAFAGCSKNPQEPAANAQAGITSAAPSMVGESATQTAPTPEASASAPSGPAAPAADAPPHNFKVLGRDDAPVAIIEFTDLQCPYCAQFARETFPKLRKHYIDTGRVKFGSSDLPLTMHPQSLSAAIAARCAGEQGRYWEYREHVFDAQNELGHSPFARWAAELGLDVPRFEACRSDDRQLELVAQDASNAANLGIRSTPTFVIGRVMNGQFQGETLYGVQSYEVFAQKIDAQLAASRGRP